MRFLPSLAFVVVAPAILVALSGGCGGSPVAPPPRPPAPKVTPPKPVAAAPSRLPAPDVDRAIRAAWTAAGVTPAKPADDATWLRRVTFDIVGAPPSPEDVLAFVADKSLDKRAKKVDALLASPLYATHWTNVWDDILVGHDVRDPRLDRAELRAWLYGRFSANAPWDKMVAELVSATGQNSEGGTRNALPMDVPTPDAPNGMAGMNGMGGTGGVTSDAPTVASGAQGVNGAVNYTLRFQTPQDLAGSASRTFLGVQIQCAQCHDHKTEKWKQDDFRKLTAAFLHAEIEPIDKGQTKGIRRVVVSDTARVQARSAKNAELAPIAAATPTALDGTVLDKGKETRKELATWMTSPKNPWFAKAYVNRIWAHFIGRGFVNPVDDLRVGNPTTLPETLEAIAKDFAENSFDTKALIRLVCASEVYGLDARGGENIAPENVTWARFRIVPLGPEELLNHLFAATRLDRAAEAAGVKNLPLIRAQLVKSYSFLFDVDEVQDARTFEGNVTQALSLLNGNVTGYGTRALPGSALGEILAASGTDEEKIGKIYYRVLSRPPTEADTARAIAFLKEAESRPEPTPATAPAAPPPATPSPIVVKWEGGMPPPGGAKKDGPKRPAQDVAALARLGVGRGKGREGARVRAFEDLFWVLLTSSESLMNH